MTLTHRAALAALVMAASTGPALAIDEIRATVAPYVFIGDFDGGGTCRWSGTVP